MLNRYYLQLIDEEEAAIDHERIVEFDWNGQELVVIAES
jgi:hypothetical protein